MKRILACLLAALLLFTPTACGRGAGEGKTCLGDLMSPDVKAVTLILRREGSAVWIGTGEADEGEEYEIADLRDADLSAVRQLSGLERLVLDFERDLPDSEQMRKITESFLSLPSLHSVMIESAPFDLSGLQEVFPRETHLVRCTFRGAIDLSGVEALYLTDSAWKETSFTGTDGISSLFLDGSAVPERPGSLSAFPALARLSLPVGTGSYTGDWPIELTGERPEIPEGIELPFTEEDIRSCLEGSGDLVIVLRPSL